MNPSLVKMLHQILNPMLYPFKTLIRKPRHIFRTIPKLILRKIERFMKKKLSLGKKEQSLEQYISVGRYYVSKKLVFLLAFGLLTLGIYFFIHPPAFLNWTATEQVTVLHENVDDLTEQNGMVQYFDTSGLLKYEGTMLDGLYHGHGKLYHNQVLLYEGEFSHGFQEGNGKLFNEQGVLIYEGMFEQNTRHGAGKAFNDQGELIYSGPFKQDLKHGQGESYYPNGQIAYQGEFVHDVISGSGVSYHTNQAIKYEGQFQAGQFSGSGKLFDQHGALLYEGAFNQGLYSGQGTLYDQAGFILYQGQFNKGRFHGVGESFHENGQLQYQGFFTDDAYHGQGTLFDEAGRLQYEGLFNQGQFHGVGSLYNQDGFILYKGFFEHGQIALAHFIGLSYAQLVDLLGEPSQVEALTFLQDDHVRQANHTYPLPTSHNALATPVSEFIEKNATDEHPEIPLAPAAQLETEASTDIYVMQTFKLNYENYQLAFIVERNPDYPDLTVVTEIQAWGAEFLGRLETELSELHQLYAMNKSDGISNTIHEASEGKTYSIYFVDDMEFVFTNTDPQGVPFYLKVSRP